MPNPTRKRLFFIAYGGAHIQMLLPVIRGFTAQGHDCITLALTTAQPVMRQHSMDYIGFADLLPPGDEGILALGKRLSLDLPTPPVDERETYAYLGLSYRDLETRMGPEAAAALYAKEGRQCFEPVGVLTQALRHYRPDMVIATSSPRSEKAAVHAARTLGIAAVCLYDFFGLASPWAIRPDYADRLLVFSDITRDSLVRQGRPAEHIVVTGNPAMDRLAGPEWPAKALAWRREKGWEHNPVIFWASNHEPPPNDDLPARIDATLLDALTRHEDWRLIVRFHPSEAIRFTEAGKQVHFSPAAEELTPLLFACDACVTIVSTVGLEAAMLEKPLVSVDMSVHTPAASLTPLGLSQGVTQLSQLEPCIEAALKRGPYKRPALPSVGQATQKVMAEINAMLSPSPFGRRLG